MDKPRTDRRGIWRERLRPFVFVVGSLGALIVVIGALGFAFGRYYVNERVGQASSLAAPGETAVAGKAGWPAWKATPVVALVNVNVVPMDSERVLERQTVIVRDGRIAQVGPMDSVAVPRDAVRVAGEGRYLLPGLADMHIHLRGPGVNEGILQLLIANGVTTALNLYGRPRDLKLRDAIARGERPGPTLFTSGPFISDAPGPPPDPEEIERDVIAQKRAGYDIIKIHGEFTQEGFQRLFAVARREGIRVIGHAPRSLGAEAMIEQRMHAVAHMEEYLYSYFQYGPRRERPPLTEEGQQKFLNERGEMIPELAKRTAEAGTWVVANLTAYKTIGWQAADIDAVLARPEVRYVPQDIASNWQPQRNTYVRRFNKDAAPIFAVQYSLLQKATAGMQAAGVRLLAGTDTPIPSIVPGFSLHDELYEMTASGLTPYQALRTATANPAEFLGEMDRAGTIAVGKRADLLLVEGNPLEDIRRTTRINGVMVRGQWLSRADLDAMLAKLAAAN
jgi:imidazolonepropionase-like amidohydrolase